MTNRSVGRNFLSTGHPPDRSWTESDQTRPSWREKGPRSTRDSGMGSMENGYGLVPPQPGRRKRYADDGTLGGRYADVKRTVENVQWEDSQKRILFESEDVGSVSSSSDSQEVRPGWPPVDMGADSTRGRQSFSEKERQGLQLLSPAVRSKVLELQRDLEEAKAESRYLRAKPVDGPAVATSHLRFTKTPVPRYDGVSDWDQYREVFEAIVVSNGWNDLTAALQLLAHVDGEALNVALLVPEDQRRRPGVLMETLTAHYTSPGRLAQRRRQFEQMMRPPGQDPAVFAIALETSVCSYMFDLLAALLEMSSASFLKSISESNYDRLYDLPAGIPDVMGLQALRPSAAVCIVMSIPDSNSVRVITPDEHVPTGFHEILIEDMGMKEWPKVALSEIGCLRLDWPQEFFTFVGRYQLELEQMRKECRDRFEGISSGACPTCKKFIQNNLGRHVAMYHLDLAQLWRCPVGWCPVWKGTSQDCIDHMRRAHNTPITMKAGNLARWFPPWTVTREQWHNMSRPSVSGIAIDTFLFSRIGMSLFHRYRVFDRFGSHPAFRRPYMTNIFVFLKESDSEAIRRSHRRRARELDAGMSQPASQPSSVTRSVMSRTIQSGPAPQRTVVSSVMGHQTDTLFVTPAGGASGSSGISRTSRSREDDTVQALMDLSLPRFTRLDEGRQPKPKLWPITEQPPSSPASVRDGNVTRTPSPCYQLDDLTSASSTGGTMSNEYRLTLSTDSSNSMTPVGSIVSFSDDDLPLESDQEDTRQVLRRDLDDDVPPGPSGVPEYIPLSGKKTVEDPIYTPTPRDKLVRVPISRVNPADENMFDPMLGEWPVDDLTEPEKMTRHKPTGGKSF